MNKSRLVHLGFALVVVMLLADAALVYRASLRMLANDRRVAHTQAVLTQLEAQSATPALESQRRCCHVSSTRSSRSIIRPIARGAGWASG